MHICAHHERDNMREPTKLCLTIVFVNLILLHPTRAQTGGTFDLSHSVIASGGGSNSTGGSGGQTFTVDGTAGQNIAGTISTSASPQFSIRGGFWAFQAAGPTAAAVTIRGRISTAGGDPVFRGRVTLAGSSGTTRTAIANQFGYYRFDEVEAGQAYVISVTAKRLQFVSRVVFVTDELNGLDFIALS